MQKNNEHKFRQDILNLDIFNQVPASYSVFDNNSRILVTNTTASEWMGFSGHDDVSGLTYADMRCKAAEQADYFMWQDAFVKSHGYLQFVGYFSFGGGEWKVVFGEKARIILPNNMGEGMISHFGDVTRANILDTARFMLKLDNKHHFLSAKKQFGYVLTETYYDDNLSEREAECLFFLMRGLTAKSIAQIFKSSIRTIEVHIANIKIKMACKSKAEVVEKAIEKGFLNIIPKSLL